MHNRHLILILLCFVYLGARAHKCQRVCLVGGNIYHASDLSSPEASSMVYTYNTDH